MITFGWARRASAFASLTSRDQFVKMGHIICWQPRMVVSNHQRGLVHCQLRKPCACKVTCSIQSQDGAGGMTKDEGRSASRDDHSIEILDFALNRIASSEGSPQSIESVH